MDGTQHPFDGSLAVVAIRIAEALESTESKRCKKLPALGKLHANRIGCGCA